MDSHQYARVENNQIYLYLGGMWERVSSFFAKSFSWNLQRCDAEAHKDQIDAIQSALEELK